MINSSYLLYLLMFVGWLQDISVSDLSELFDHTSFIDIRTKEFHDNCTEEKRVHNDID